MLPKLDGVVYSQRCFQLIFLGDTNTAGLLRISERTEYLIDVHLWMKKCSKKDRRDSVFGCCGGESVPIADLQITLCIELCTRQVRLCFTDTP